MKIAWLLCLNDKDYLGIFQKKKKNYEKERTKQNGGRVFKNWKILISGYCNRKASMEIHG